MKYKIIYLIIALVLVWSNCHSHCQIPCGIYGDDNRFEILSEHIQTIEKSIKMIIELQKEPGKNSNQLIRWVNNKEEHADYIIDIISDYFLAQRIKPQSLEQSGSKEQYLKKISLLHEIIYYSMKSKQQLKLSNTDKLKQLLKDFEILYKSH